MMQHRITPHLLSHFRTFLVTTIILFNAFQVSDQESKIQTDVNQFIRKIASAKAWRDHPKIRIVLETPSKLEERDPRV